MKYIPTFRTGIAGLLSMSALSISALLHAETLSYEGFDMPPGELDNQSGETSFGWRTQDGQQLTWWAWEQSEPGISLYHGVTADGLEYPDLPSVGGAFYFENELAQGNVVTHRFIPGFINYYGAGQRWISALFNAKIDGDPTGGGWFQLALSDSIARHASIYLGTSNNATFNQAVWSAGGERVYIDGVRGEKWSVSDVPVVEDETVFLVFHLDLDAKEAAWYVNPPVDSDDPGEPVARFTILTDLFVDRIMLRVFNNGPSQVKEVPDFETQGLGADYTGTRVDEIRIGSTYASVAGAATVPDGGGEVDTTPPVVTGASGEPGDASSSTSILEGTVRVVTMTADEAVSWTVSGGADGSLFTIGAGTGGLSFAVPPVFANPNDANLDNVYEVEITATDLAGNTATHTVSATVLYDDTWADLTIVNDHVQTGETYLGELYVPLKPWLYSTVLENFVHLEEDNYSAAGSWTYMLTYGQVLYGEMEGWYYSADFSTWFYITDYAEGGSGWAFVLNAGYVEPEA